MSLVIAKSIKEGDIETINTLIKNGVNVNGAGATDLMLIDFALEYDRFEIFKLLVESGAETRRVNKNGTTILHKSILRGATTFVLFLLEGGYSDINSVDSEGNTSLHLAVIMEDVPLVEFLMSKRFKTTLDMSIKNSYGKTALEVAASFPHNEIVRLIAHGKSFKQEANMQNIFLENDIHLEGLLLSASDMIHDLKSKLEAKSPGGVSTGVHQAEAVRLGVEIKNMTKSMRLKEVIIERLKKQNMDLNESILEEKLSNETLVSNMAKMQSQLDLVGEIDSLNRKVGALV